MAEMFYTADVLYPEYKDGNDIKQYVQQVSDYLFLLREGLGYTLNNLGMKNFNQEQINVLGEVIREPVQIQITDQEGRLTEVSATLDGVSSTVSAIDGNYVSLSSATQTTSGFEFKVMDGDDDAAVVMDSSGLTVNNGAIRIKNRLGTDVLSADTSGNLTLTGTVEGSTIYGSDVYTCPKNDVNTGTYFYIGSSSGYPLIQSLGAGAANGFRAEGIHYDPNYGTVDSYYGLFIANTVDYRTVYDSATSSVHTGVHGSKAFIGCANGEVGFAYNDPVNNIRHYINVTSTGLYLVGNVYINGVPQ